MAEKVKCTIVSGAPESDYDFLRENTDLNSFIIAADSGYKKLEKIGVIPDLIVADFDSSEKPKADIKCEVFPIEKEYTDTFNAVRIAVERGFKEIIILGAVGGRIDHTYSNILCLDYAAKNGAECVITDRNNRISLIKGEKTFKKDYKWFSVFAFLGDCKGVSFIGAHYSQEFFGKDSLDFDMASQVGQSNYIENEECTVTVKEGTLLLIESNDYR